METRVRFLRHRINVITKQCWTKQCFPRTCCTELQGVCPFQDAVGCLPSIPLTRPLPDRVPFSVQGSTTSRAAHVKELWPPGVTAAPSFLWRVTNSEVDMWLRGPMRLDFGTHGMLGQWCSLLFLGHELEAPGCHPATTADKACAVGSSREKRRKISFLADTDTQGPAKRMPFF